MNYQGYLRPPINYHFITKNLLSSVKTVKFQVNCTVHDIIPLVNDTVYGTIHAHDLLTVTFDAFD